MNQLELEQGQANFTVMGFNDTSSLTEFYRNNSGSMWGGQYLVAAHTLKFLLCLLF